MQAIDHLCSCVRSLDLQQRLRAAGEVLQYLEGPKSGDLVFVEVVGSDGAYTKLETAPDGFDQTLTPGATFLGVLANRFSGHNPSGVVPTGPLRCGDVLQLLAAGGIVGQVTHVPSYMSSRSLDLKIIGFPKTEAATVFNIGDHPPLQRNHTVPVGTTIRLITICGSSAEVGKTSIIEGLIRAAREQMPDIRFGAVKACGTGRLKDKMRYSAAGAQWAADFVDAGLPTTYGIEEEEIISSLQTLLSSGRANGCGVLLIEIGGDPLEAGAPALLRALSDMKSEIVFVTGDALAAMSGLSILSDTGFSKIVLASMRQNAHSLAKRLKIERAYDVGSKQDAKDIIENYFVRRLPIHSR
jgi:hypothetical protein